MTENNLNAPNTYGNPQNLAESYLAMQSLTADKVVPERSKRASLLNEAGKNFGGLFALEGNSEVVEQQRLGMRKRLGQIYAELDNNPDPVPENNGYFTKGYQTALFRLVDQGAATEEQREEAKIIRRQNTLIAEKRFDELPKAPAPDPQDTYQGPSFSSYLNDIDKRSQRSRPYARSPKPQLQKEGLFARAGKKLSSAWKTVKGWFTR